LPSKRGSRVSICTTPRIAALSYNAGVGPRTISMREIVLDATKPADRRLDFQMQELKREANTLSSISQDDETTHAAVDRCGPD